MLFDPVGVVNALKGQYNLAQGLGPGEGHRPDPIGPRQLIRPCKGLITNPMHTVHPDRHYTTGISCETHPETSPSCDAPPGL